MNLRPNMLSNDLINLFFIQAQHMDMIIRSISMLINKQTKKKKETEKKLVYESIQMIWKNSSSLSIDKIVFTLVYYVDLVKRYSSTEI